MELRVSPALPCVEASLHCVLEHLRNEDQCRSFHITLGVEKPEYVVLADLLKSGSLKCVRSVGSVLGVVQETCGRCNGAASGKRGEIQLKFSVEDVKCKACDPPKKGSDGAEESQSLGRGRRPSKRRSSGNYKCHVCQKKFITPAYLRKHVEEHGSGTTSRLARVAITRRSKVISHPPCHVGKKRGQTCLEDDTVQSSDSGKIQPKNRIIKQHKIKNRIIKQEMDSKTKRYCKKDDTHECNVCRKEFPDRHRLKQHKVSHLPRSEFAHECEMCGTKFKWRSHLSEHRQYHCSHNKSTREHEDSEHCERVRRSARIESGQKLTVQDDVNYKAKDDQAVVSMQECDVILEKDNTLSTTSISKIISVGDKENDDKLQQKLDVVSPEALTPSTSFVGAQSTNHQYKCLQCNRAFGRRASLQNHEANHKAGVQFECQLCGQTFRNLSELVSHKKNHDNSCAVQITSTTSNISLHGISEKSCGRVESGAKESEQVKIEHTSYENKDDVDNGDICSKTLVELGNNKTAHSLAKDHNTTNAASLMETNSEHTDKIASSVEEACENRNESDPIVGDIAGGDSEAEETPACLPPASTASDVDVQNPSRRATYTCTVCGKMFSRLSTMKVHHRRHKREAKHKCDVCGKAYVYRSYLRDHEKSHLLPEEYLNKCKICGKTFKRGCNLNEHMLIHLKDSVRSDRKRPRPNATDLIDSDLESENCVVDTRRFKMFKCTVCDIEFRTKFKLKFHEMTHTNDSNECDECEMSFSDVRKLHDHKLSHLAMKGYTCSACGKTSLPTSWDLYKHMKTHRGDNSLLCRSCSTDFDSLTSLAEHRCQVEFFCDVCGEDFPNQTVGVEHAECHDESMCTVCLKKLPSLWKLKRHMAIHDEGDCSRSTCNECGKVVQTKYLKEHKLFHEGNDVLKCDICNTGFKSEYNLRAHRRNMHKLSRGRTVLQCHLCGKRMSSQDIFDKHVASNCTFNEDQKEKCKICGLLAFNSVRLEQHMRIHTGSEKHYICELCGKGFYSNGSLKSHLYTHQNHRPHKCDVCGRKFRNLLQMKNHHKMHTGEGLLQCDKCKDWFVNESYLKNQHPRYCKGGQVYTCQYCRRVFNDKKIFESHIGFHTGDRPFQCHECGKAFSKEASCTGHHKSHFQALQFRCRLCDKGFKHMTGLRKHEKLHDKEHRYMKRYTLRPELKPKSVTKEGGVTEEELNEVTSILAEEMTTTHITVIKEEVQTELSEIDQEQISVEAVHQVDVMEEGEIPSTSIQNDSGESVITITTLPSGQLTFSGYGENVQLTQGLSLLSNESVLMVTINPEETVE